MKWTTSVVSDKKESRSGLRFNFIGDKRDKGMVVDLLNII